MQFLKRISYLDSHLNTNLIRFIHIIVAYMSVYIFSFINILLNENILFKYISI